MVSGGAAALALAFITWGILNTDSLSIAANVALNYLVRDGGWAFVLAGTGFVIFGVWLAFSRFGKIRLGSDNEKPEFRNTSWIAMMFAAGMGIGLMFYGVNEPLTHFTDPPPDTATAESDEAVRKAMAISLFHWTLHPWAIYAVVGLALAYSSYRRGRRQLLSSAFVPLFGQQRTNGPAGKMIDVLAILATIFGTAASLGLGATQIASGLTEVGWIDSRGQTVLILIIVALIGAFVASAASGVSNGIQWLSNSNMVLAISLAVFLFVVGPTVFILDLLPTSIGAYVNQFSTMISRTGATGGAEMNAWLSSWTIFYWAWWISWAPFVGMFIARISRGRTIRQFVGGVILVPTVISLVWFAILGGTALDQQRSGSELAEFGSADAQLFGMLQDVPLGNIVSGLAILLIINFFITSADSASVVIGSLSQEGSTRPQTWIVIFWGIVIGGVATVMLVTGGNKALTSLQNITIIAASPFLIVVVMLCMSLLKDLRHDKAILREEKGTQVLEAAVIHGVEKHEGEFQLKISSTDSQDNANRSGSTTVQPAHQERKIEHDKSQPPRVVV
ncbi:BCCT family transporter [Haloactinomyces albus]|uniref:BCCT family transporter n=1 Tax=Haloactinomyces albus TaxID=1352928 RepID=UPI0035B52064